MKNKANNKGIFMKNLNKIGLFVVFIFAIFGLFAPKAFAMTPTLSLYSTGNNSVQITVNGDAYASVNLNYYPNGNGSIISSNIGSTNQNGYFNTSLNTNTYNIQQNSSVYITVNGSQSNSVSWPYNNNYNNGGSIYLSQSSLNVNSNQTVTDYIYGGSGTYNISSNSNSSIASAYITGNTVNVYGYNPGSTNITICSVNSGYGCVTLYVIVNGNNYNYSPVTLSQSNVSVGIGQSVNVGISGGTGLYYISSNTNQYLATVSTNGNTLSVYGRQVGSENVTICSSVVNNYNSGNGNGNNYSYNSCADLVINVGQGYAYNNSYINSGSNTSGVFLSQVPYTGANSNTGVVLFVIGLWIWSASIAYFIFKKTSKDSFFQFANSSKKISQRDLIAKFKKENLERRG